MITDPSIKIEIINITLDLWISAFAFQYLNSYFKCQEAKNAEFTHTDLYKIMYEFFVVLFLNRNPFIYLHMKIYSETKILHFYLPKEIWNAAISYNNSFFKEHKSNRKDYKNPGGTRDKRHTLFPHSPFSTTCLHINTHPTA